MQQARGKKETSQSSSCHHDRHLHPGHASPDEKFAYPDDDPGSAVPDFESFQHSVLLIGVIGFIYEAIQVSLQE